MERPFQSVEKSIDLLFHLHGGARAARACRRSAAPSGCPKSTAHRLLAPLAAPRPGRARRLGRYRPGFAPRRARARRAPARDPLVAAARPVLEAEAAGARRDGLPDGRARRPASPCSRRPRARGFLRAAPQVGEHGAACTRPRWASSSSPSRPSASRSSERLDAFTPATRATPEALAREVERARARLRGEPRRVDPGPRRGGGAGAASPARMPARGLDRRARASRRHAALRELGRRARARGARACARRAASQAPARARARSERGGGTDEDLDRRRDRDGAARRASPSSTTASSTATASSRASAPTAGASSASRTTCAASRPARACSASRSRAASTPCARIMLATARAQRRRPTPTCASSSRAARASSASIRPPAPSRASSASPTTIRLFPPEKLDRGPRPRDLELAAAAGPTCSTRA